MQKSQPLNLTAKTCVDDEGINENVRYNLDHINKWVEPLRLHDRKAVIVSAGPSVKQHLEQIRDLKYFGYDIYCVKHSLPILVEAGIEPTACIVLDPRPVHGKSTHGIKRSKLFDVAKKGTNFLVASMTNQKTTKYLQRKGMNVIGWHAAVGEIVHKFRSEINCSITGGSSSAVRGLYLLHAMGYRHITCVGFDSSMDFIPTEEQKQERTDEGAMKYLQIEALGKKYWTSGELVCQAQDLELLWKIRSVDVLYDFLEGGMVGETFKVIYADRMRPEIASWWDSVK